MKVDKRISLGALMVLLATVMIARKLSPPDASRGSSDPQGHQLSGQENQLNAAAERTPTSASGTSQSGSKPGFAAKSAEEVRAEVLERIQEASTTYDPTQLPVIRPYLIHPDPELRAAAMNGMVVLGDASAGPMFRDAARRLGSPEEVKALEQAADYIELPPASLNKLAEEARERMKVENKDEPVAPLEPPSE